MSSKVVPKPTEIVQEGSVTLLQGASEFYIISGACGNQGNVVLCLYCTGITLTDPNTFDITCSFRGHSDQIVSETVSNMTGAAVGVSFEVKQEVRGVHVDFRLDNVGGAAGSDITFNYMLLFRVSPATVTQFSLENIGGGAEVYKAPYEARTITSTDASVTVTQNADTVNLATTPFTLANIGGAAELYKSPSEMRTVTSSDTSITVTQNANTIDLTIPGALTPIGTTRSCGLTFAGTVGETFYLNCDTIITNLALAYVSNTIKIYVNDVDSGYSVTCTGSPAINTNQLYVYNGDKIQVRSTGSSLWSASYDCIFLY